jgi:hypothetical protein
MMVDQNVIAEGDRKDLLEGNADWIMAGAGLRSALWFWSENEEGEPTDLSADYDASLSKPKQ